MKLLVTGGAGYIGSVAATCLTEAGHDVVVLDDLSTGHADAVPAGVQLVRVGLGESAAVLTRAAGFDGVLHFAAKSLVAESVERPELYWHNNVGGSLALLLAMRDAGVPRLVFSSTCATYGEPEATPITEDAPTRPTTAYGASKLAVDAMIASFCRAYGLAAVSLRYFNVVGAVGAAGERHTIETHLVPNALKVALGERDCLDVYGDDYATADGTCVRDYVHVQDLVDAHLSALRVAAPGEHQVINLGTGTGFSVRQVVDAARQVTSREIPIRIAPRRPGDPPILVAGHQRAREVLGWNPRHTTLEKMIGDAWRFACRDRRRQ